MYSPFRHMRDIVWKGRPIHLTFFVTNRCNSRCPFCFYLKSERTAAAALPELSLAEIEKISSSLGTLLWLAFSGGEIFLREDLVEIATAFYRNNKPSIMLFPTNGLMPEVIRERIEKILSACPNSVIALKLSIDGVGKEHDVLRNVPGSFDRTVETYRAVSGLLERHRHFELGVNTVFCSENQDTMDEIIDYVRGLVNIKTHTISLVRGDLADKRFANIDHEKYLAAVQKLEQNLKRGISPLYRFQGARIKAAQDILQRRIIHRTLEQNARVLPCFAGRLNLVLNEAGEVFPCELLDTSFGNVRDFGYDMRRVAGSETAGKVLAAIKKGCYCTHECYLMTNILFNPLMYPRIIKEYLQIQQ